MQTSVRRKSSVQELVRCVLDLMACGPSEFATKDTP